MATVAIFWKMDNGALIGPLPQGELDVVPLVGDHIVFVFSSGPDAYEVTERYLVRDGKLGDVWHLILKRVELSSRIIKALGLSGPDTKRRWEQFEHQAAARSAEANKRLDDARKEARERREKERRK